MSWPLWSWAPFCDHTAYPHSQLLWCHCSDCAEMQSTTDFRKSLGHVEPILWLYPLFIPIMCIYLQPPSGKFSRSRQVHNSFFILLSHLASTLIYTLRNKDVKGAVKRLMGWDRRWEITCPATFVHRVLCISEVSSAPLRRDGIFSLQPTKHRRKVLPPNYCSFLFVHSEIFSKDNLFDSYNFNL